MKQYVVDAFTDSVFKGNQAGILICESWPSLDLMMNITKENCFSETAFAVKEGEKYGLRWFTPGGEIDLCGHATLACAYVLFRFCIPEETRIVFSTLSGDLIVTKKEDGLLEMEFPPYVLTPVEVTDEMEAALGARPVEAYMGRDLVVVMENEDVVKNLAPDTEKVKALPGLLCQVTSRGRETDCVSRTFGPKCGIVEDPVCGSGHCHFTVLWTGKLQKENIVAYQASPRGGMLWCGMKNGKVTIAGKAALYSEAELFV